jgi:hypothetical protein
MAGKKRRRDPPPSHSQLPNGASDTLATASTGITDASVLPATSPQDGLGFLLGQEVRLSSSLFMRLRSQQAADDDAHHASQLKDLV